MFFNKNTQINFCKVNFVCIIFFCFVVANPFARYDLPGISSGGLKPVNLSSFLKRAGQKLLVSDFALLVHFFTGSTTK
ncbi:MAG: hypothetical protein ACI4JM_11105 [Oscillospiraceae bacterium]